MNKTLLILTMAITLASCGDGNNKVNSGSAPTVTPNTGGVNTLTPETPVIASEPLVNFAGHYVNLDTRRDSACGVNLEIVRQCDGYIVRTDSRREPEDFCHVKYISARGNEYDRNPPNPDRNPPNPDRNPPNPDRNPPNPDRNPPNPDDVTVTQKGNLLTSEIRIADYSFTSTLSLQDGILEKISDSKSNRKFRCVYQKR